jgi:hypothetical protein
MALTENKKIAIWPTVKQALHMLWAARGEHAILSFLAVLPFIVMGALGWLDPIFTPPPAGASLPPDYVQAELEFLGWMLLWLIPFAILWQRLFLVGPHLFLKVTAGSLIKMWLRLVGYYLALALILAALAILFLAASSGLVMVWQYALGATGPSLAITTAKFAAIVFALSALLIVMRLMPAFVSVALGENIPPRRSWQIMENNAGLLMLASFLVMLPVSALGDIIVGLMIGLINGFGPEQATTPPNLMSYFVILALSPLISAAAALQMAVMAIIYRDLVPQPEHLVDLSV